MSATSRRLVLASGLLSLAALSACAAERPPDPSVLPASGAQGATQPDTRPFPQRKRMIEDQLKARGITNAAVLEAMAKVPRHEFVPPDLRHAAYADHPLPIGYDQTISQPYIVAYMTQMLELERDHRVLEIGTGSGYQAAVLAELVNEVYTIEIIEELASTARTRLGALGYDNVRVRAGNGYEGWPEHAPFDRIVVTAAPPEIPKALTDQLALGGRLVIPVGTWNQEIVIVTRTKEGLREERTLPVRFVPMTGRPDREEAPG